MKALVTGVDGFVGSHLAHHLLALGGFEVFGTTFGPTTAYDALGASGVVLYQVDLTDESAVQRLFRELQPDQIYHLAAQSFVPASYANPWATLQNNIHAQLNVLHTVVESGLASKVLVVGSAEEYGNASPDAIPIDEQQPLRPTSPYSVSKVAQDMLGLQYFLSHNVAAIRVRPFNHTGPGQSPQFVVPAFASQIAEIENGRKPPIILVGNLEARRDISDVRDVVQAYEMLLDSGTPGEVYNIGRGVAHSIQEILDTLLSLSSQKIEVQSDPLRYRPIDSPLVVCDSSKLRAATGWTPRYSIDQTLADVLAYWRGESSERHSL